MITIAGDAQREIVGRIVLVDNNTLIKSASLSQNVDATGRTRCATGFSPSTSISPTDPRYAGGKSFPFPITR